MKKIFVCNVLLLSLYSFVSFAQTREATESSDIHKILAQPETPSKYSRDVMSIWNKFLEGASNTYRQHHNLEKLAETFQEVVNERNKARLTTVETDGQRERLEKLEKDVRKVVDIYTENNMHEGKNLEFILDSIEKGDEGVCGEVAKRVKEFLPNVRNEKLKEVLKAFESSVGTAFSRGLTTGLLYVEGAKNIESEESRDGINWDAAFVPSSLIHTEILENVGLRQYHMGDEDQAMEKAQIELFRETIKFLGSGRPDVIKVFSSLADLALQAANGVRVDRGEIAFKDQPIRLSPMTLTIIQTARNNYDQTHKTESQELIDWELNWGKYQSYTQAPSKKKSIDWANRYFAPIHFENLPSDLFGVWAQFAEILDDMAFYFEDKMTSIIMHPQPSQSSHMGSQQTPSVPYVLANPKSPPKQNLLSQTERTFVSIYPGLDVTMMPRVLTEAQTHYKNWQDQLLDENENLSNLIQKSIALLPNTSKRLLLTALIFYPYSESARNLFRISERTERFFTVKNLGAPQNKELRPLLSRIGQKLMAELDEQNQSLNFCGQIF